MIKKLKTIVRKTPMEIYVYIHEDPINVFNFRDELKLKLPDWSEFSLLIVNTKSHRLEMIVYEDFEGLFTEYAEVLLKQKVNVQYFTFHKKKNDWLFFLPPPVVGPNTQTKLKSYL